MFHCFYNRGTPIPVCQEPLNRVALHDHTHLPHSPDAAQLARQTAAKDFCSSLLASTIQSHQKLARFDLLWPRVLDGLVERTLAEFANIDQEMKTLLEQL